MRSFATEIPIKTLAAMAVGVGVTAIMSGCVFANNMGPVDISVRGGSLELAFCEGGVVEHLLVEQRVPSDDENPIWETVWEGTGRLVARSGDTLFLDDSVEGLVGGTLGSLELAEGTKYGVTITYAPTHTGGPPAEFEPLFVAPSGGFKEGVWLDYSGRSSPTPCD